MKTARAATKTASREEYQPASEAAARLLALTKERKYTLIYLSRLIGKSDAYLQQFIWRGVPKELDMELRVQLSTILACDLDEITVDREKNKYFRQLTRKLQRKSGGIVREEGWCPRLGVAGSGDKKGRVDFTGAGEGVRGMATLSLLSDVEGAYSTVMPDRRMEPAIRDHDQVFVNPKRAPKSGDDVVVRMKDGTGVIGQLIAETDLLVVLRHHNPMNEFTIPKKEISALHYIVGATHDDAA